MKFAPYSYSKIASFKQCPYKFKLQYIDKVDIPFETNIALEKGSYIHHLIEKHLKNEQPKDYKFRLSEQKDIDEYNKIFINLKLNPLFQALTQKDNCEFYIEEGFGLKVENKQIIATKYKKDAIIRGYIDFLKICENKAYVIDWKTGKYRKEQDRLQTLVYAVWTFLKFEKIEYIETIFYFVEHNKIVTHKYTRNDLKELIKEFLLHIRDIEKCKNFKKKPSPLCDWCPMKKFGYCDGEISLNELNKLNPFK